MTPDDTGSVPPDPVPDAWAQRLSAVRTSPDAEAAWPLLLQAAAEAGDDEQRWDALAHACAAPGLAERWLQHLREAATADTAQAWRRLGWTCREIERLDEAHAAFEAACRALRPAAPGDWGEAVFYGLMSGRWQETLQDLDEIERLLAGPGMAPEDGPWLHLHRAICLGRLGRVEEAAQQLQGLAPPLPEPQQYGRVSVLALRGWLDQLQAEGQDTVLAQAAALAEGWTLPPDEARDLLIVRMGALLRLGRNLEIADLAAQLRALADQAPAPAALAFFDAFGQEAQGRAEEALAQARTALALTGEAGLRAELVPLMRLVAGRALLSLERAQEALDELAAIQIEGQDPAVAAEVDFQHARAASALGRHQEVLDALARAETHLNASRRPLGHWLRASALFALQQMPQAQAAFAEAARLGATAGDRASAWLQSAVAAEAAGQTDDADAAAASAVEAAEQGLAERPDDAALQATWVAAQSLKAQGTFRRRDAAATLATLEAVRERAPDIVSALMWQVMRIESLLGQQRVEEALAAARQALALPALQGHPYLLNHVAEAGMRLHLGAEALEARRQGAAAMPEAMAQDPLAHLGQAACRTALGDLAGAKASVQRTLELNPRFERNLMLRTVRMSCRLGDTEHPHAEEDLGLVDQLLADPSVPPRSAQWAVLMQARGLLLNQLERWQEAEASFGELSAALPIEGAPSGIDIMAGLLRSRALLKLEREPQARQVLEAGDQAEARGLLGLSMQGVARMTLALLRAADGLKAEALTSAERAQQAFEAAAAKATGAPTLKAMRAMAQGSVRLQARLLRGHLERPQEALARLSPLLEKPAAGEAAGGRLESMAVRAQCLADLQDWPAALAATRALREALLAAPESERPADLNLDNDLLEAEVHLRLGSWPAAEAILMNALQQHGPTAADRAELWWRLGRAYLGGDRWAPARQVLRRAEGLLAAGTGASVRKIRSDVASRLAVALLRSAEPAPALAVLEAAERHDPLSATMLFNRAVALLDLYRREPREELLDQARGALEAARRAGQPDAAALARQIAKREAQQGGWFGYWFGPDAPTDRHLLGALLTLAVGGLVFTPLALALWRGAAPDWTALAPPAAVTVALLLLPSMRSLSLSWGDAKFSAEPAAGSATGNTSIPATLAVVDSGELVQGGVDRMFADLDPSLFANVSEVAVEWASGLHDVGPQAPLAGSARPTFGTPPVP